MSEIWKWFELCEEKERKQRKRTNNLSNDIKRTDSDMLVQVLQKVTIHKYCNLVSMKWMLWFTL